MNTSKSIAVIPFVNLSLEGENEFFCDGITEELINVEDDAHIWSETWDRPMDNIFELQDEISFQIAGKLREQYGHLYISEHLVQSPTQNLNAYEHLLMGKDLIRQWNPNDTQKVLEINIQYLADNDLETLNSL